MRTSLPCASQPEFLEDVTPAASDALEIVRMLADRVAAQHGANHPYLLELQSLVSGPPNQHMFAILRGITNNYSLPSDACLSFRALYERLADLEEQR